MMAAEVANQRLPEQIGEMEGKYTSYNIGHSTESASWLIIA
jgi:hypothetical protein